MLRLSKRTEYGLMAVQYMARQSSKTALSVAEIAAECQIPDGLLAKILQTLRKEGVVSAVRGPSGGYRLEQEPRDLSFLTFVNLFEERVSVVECATAGASAGAFPAPTRAPFSPPPVRARARLSGSPTVPGAPPPGTGSGQE